MESYTPTRLDFRSSLIKSHNSLFYSIQYFIPLSSFRAYRLGQSAPGTLLSKGLLAELGGKQLVPALAAVFHDAGGCPGGLLTCIWNGGISIVVKPGCGRRRFPWLVVVGWHVSMLSRKWQIG